MVWLTLHVLHHEVRPALSRHATVEHRGDRGMHHQRERLTLGFEARDHLAGIHARLDHFQRDEPMDWARLLGKPHFSHAARAEDTNQPVRTNRQAGDRAG